MVDTNALDFDFLLQVASRSTERLRADARAAADNRAAALGEHLDQTLTVLEKRVALSAERFATYDELEQTTSMLVLRSVNGTLGEMQEAADWIAKSRDSQLHLGILYFIDQISRELGGDKIRVTPISDGRYGYSAYSWPFKHILDKLIEELGDPEPAPGFHPSVVSYPPHEQDATLLCPLFAHEIGHAAADEGNLVDKVLATKGGDFDSTFDSLATELADSQQIPLGRAEDIVQYMVDSWIAELLCDSLATHYLGPSYLFAFSPSVIAGSLNDFTDTHPPTALRIKHILNDLRDLGWLALMENELPAIFGWLGSLSAATLTPEDNLEEFCLETARDFRTRISEVAADHLEDAAFDSQAFTASLDHLTQLLVQRVLPIQMPNSAAADRRGIILSGWLFMLTNSESAFGDTPAQITAAVSDNEFQAFMAAALEMSFVLEAWGSA